MSEFTNPEEEIFEPMARYAQAIFEMANIGPRLHRFGVDVTMNLLQPGGNRLSHGPRAKFFKKGVDGDFSIALSEDPKKIRIVAGSFKGIVTQNEANRLVEKVRKYRIPLLNFWYDSAMNSDELSEQLEMIDRGEDVTLQRPVTA